ncbi:MAG: hypothetical protein KGI79_02035 [Patescibacteria group bacterium]|nr:hypothetical protein [Patescibacteria group bacterium]MDE2116631.1 hypothetical protein [Patescibacteria group bacterium]
MFDFFDKLRKKPEAERRKAVFLMSLSITLIVAVIWGIGMAMRISATDFALPANSNVPSLKDTLSSFSSQVGQLINNTEQAIQSVSSSTAAADSTSTVANGTSTLSE